MDGNTDDIDVRDVTLSAGSRDEVFHRLAELVDADPSAIVAALQAREADGGTAITTQVAIPHATVAGLDHAVLLDVSLSHALSWDSGHDQINRCFCVLVPEGGHAAHATLLAEAARRATAGPGVNVRPRSRRALNRTQPLYGFAAAALVTGTDG